MFYSCANVYIRVKEWRAAHTKNVAHTPRKIGGKRIIMLKRGFYFILVGFLAVALLAACSGNSNNNNDDPGNPNNGASGGDTDFTELENESLEITVYGHMWNGQWEERYEPFLEEKFPNYKFTFISAYDEKAGLSVEELITTGTKIDIYEGALGALDERFKPVELHTPMNDLMDKHGIDPDDFIPEFLKGGMEGDDYLMLPVSNSNFVMYYNKAIFDRFGVDHPWDGMTWDEAIELASDLNRNEGGKQYVGLWYSPPHLLRANQKSLGFVDPETNEPIIDTDEWNSYISKMFHEPYRDPGVRDRAKEKFFGHPDFRNDEVVGMYVYTTGWLMESNSLPPEWDVVSVPTFDGDGIGQQPLAKYWGLASTSKNEDAAMRVIKYLMSEEYQTYWSKEGDMSSLKSQAVQDTLYENLEDELGDKNIENAIFTNDYAEQREVTAFDETVIEGTSGDTVDGLVKEYITSIVRGNSDVNQALRSAQDSVRLLVEQEMLRQQVGGQ